MEFFKGTVTKKDWMAVGAIMGGLLVVVAVFVLFVHAKQVEEMQRVQAELVKAQGELKAAQETNRNIADLRKETEQVSTLVKDFEQRLPDKRDMPRLLKEFEAIAGEVGVDVTLNTLEPLVDKNKETLPYAVVARGDFHRITAFINRLERHARYLKVSELIISEQEDGVAEAKFTLSTYSFRQPGNAPGAAVAKATNSPAAAGGAK